MPCPGPAAGPEAPRTASGGALIEIADTGPGIPEEVLDKVFDPFFTTKASGTGLGLSICYGIAERHRGEIEILSPAARRERAGGRFQTRGRERRPGNDRPCAPPRRDPMSAPRQASPQATSLTDGPADACWWSRTRRASGRSSSSCSRPTATRSRRWATPRRALERVSDLAPDVALLDLALPGMDGIELLGRLKAEHPRLQAVIMTAHGSIASAVEAMRLGAFDYVTKPFDNTELKLVVGRALALARLEARVETLEGQLEERFRPENMVGNSGAMADIFQRIAKIAPLDTTVLIQGESGTGKELVARAIHRYSKRKDGPFVAVNCGAIPPTLVESEFFGHERGAFTGARERRRGRIELAGGGTLFLDEVADLPANAQVGLLRVLEERELVRVGGERPIPTDVRIIAASNVDLAEAVEEGVFREDLFWRLNVVAFRIPPLRERREDVPLLADHFLRRFTDKLDRRDVTGFDPAALSLLVAHDWPGNVRELENTIEHAVALASGTTVAPEDLPPRLRVGLRVGGDGGAPAGEGAPDAPRRDRPPPAGGRPRPGGGRAAHDRGRARARRRQPHRGGEGPRRLPADPVHQDPGPGCRRRVQEPEGGGRGRGIVKREPALGPDRSRNQGRSHRRQNSIRTIRWRLPGELPRLLP